MKLRVWYYNRMPGQPTHFPVKDIEEAKTVIRTLTERDLKDDRVTDNAMGLEETDENTKSEWTEYYDEDGRDIDQILMEEDDAFKTLV